MIAAGLEKNIPGSIREAIQSCGRKASLWSMGASVGLVPLQGEVINELGAIEQLTHTKPVVISCGGIMGGEGSATIIAEGEKENLEYLLDLVQWASKKSISGIPSSLISCQQGTEGCRKHNICCYKSGKGFKL